MSGDEKSGDEKSRDEKDRSRFVTFWTSLPGVLTGVAAVIAAVVSLVALFGPGRDAPAGATAADAPAGAATVATGTTAGTTTAPAGQPAGSSSAPSGSAGAGVRGSMELGLDDFADLGAGVVARGRTTTSEFFLFRAEDYRLVAAIGQTFALANGSPDRTTCTAALSKRQDRQLSLPSVRGRTVCVLTGDQRVAALTLTTLPAVGSPRLAFDYVLWS